MLTAARPLTYYCRAGMAKRRSLSARATMAPGTPMNFDLTEDQSLLKAAVERFVSDSYGGDLEARRAARRTPAGYSADFWRRLAETGVLALPVSAANGGLGGGRVELMVVMEALGRGLVAEPVLDAAVVPGALIDVAGNAAQHSALLGPLLAGDRIVALAHTERAARYNLAHVETTATRRGDAVVIDPDCAQVIGAQEDARVLHVARI